MAYIDPYYFLSRVKVPVICVIGTNDNLFGSFDDQGFYPFYGGEKRFAYVPNYAHGMGTPGHVNAFRSWAAHCFWGRPFSKVTALGERTDDGVVVQAILSSDAKDSTAAVNLHYCALKGARFNDRSDRYDSIPMTQVGISALWEARVDAADGPLYWYVEVEEEAMGLTSSSCTLLQQN